MDFLPTAIKLLFIKCDSLPSFLVQLQQFISKLPDWVILIVCISYIVLFMFLTINSVRVYNFYISLFKFKEGTRQNTELSLSKFITRINCIRDFTESHQEQIYFYNMTGIRVKQHEFQYLIDIYTATPSSIDWVNIKTSLPWLSINDGIINMFIRLVVIVVNILSACVFFSMLYLSLYLQLTINTFSNSLILALISMLLLYLASYSLSQLRGFILAVRIITYMKASKEVANVTEITS